MPFVRVSCAQPPEYSWYDDSGRRRTVQSGSGGQGDPRMPPLLLYWHPGFFGGSVEIVATRGTVVRVFLPTCSCSVCQFGWHHCTSCSQAHFSEWRGSASIRGRPGRGTKQASSQRASKIWEKRRGSHTASQSWGHQLAPHSTSPPRWKNALPRNRSCGKQSQHVPDLQCAWQLLIAKREPQSKSLHAHHAAQSVCCLLYGPRFWNLGDGQVPSPRNSQP